MAEKNMTWLGLGVWTIPADAEKIPPQSSRDSLNWISTDGAIELCRGQLLIGAEETANGSVQGHWFGYKADWTAVQFRKINTKIQYYNSTTSLWVDVVTGLTSGAEYTFSNYQSLAGTFVYVTGADGIYKIHVANPGSYTSMYDSTKNFKAKSIITTGRMLMWDLPNDKTGLYGSYIDAQDSTVYTTVSGEVIADTASGTLAFKWGGATRTCFGVTITDTSSGEVFTDNYNWVLTGSLWGTGTINYTTWAFTTSQSGWGTATYQWEDSNDNGITDFTKSSPRQAWEGFVFRQDEGGDAIQSVHVYNWSYYSIKKRSVYILTLTNDDTNATNEVFRTNIGVAYWRSSTPTGTGIVFMDTANVEKPQLTILRPNAIGDQLEPYTLAQQFDFSGYDWSECSMSTYGEFIVFSGKTQDADSNDRLFLYNYRRKTIDILSYPAQTLVQNEGRLYVWDTTTENVYEILTWFDDDDSLIENYWISGDDLFGTNNLKKSKRIRIKGIITPEQQIQVYFSPDGSEFTLIGTVRGDGSYVDYANNYTIGSSGIGSSVLGGETSYVDGSFYLCELKISQTKYRKRAIKFVATWIGYVSIDMYWENKMQMFQNRLPSRYRSKQNVSLDWTQADQ